MNLQKLMTNYAGYNLWANETLIQWLNTKPVQTLHSEIPSSFSSILKTLNHILAAEEFWLTVIAETDLETNRYAATNLSIDEVLPSLISRSAEMAEFIASLSEQDLEKMVYLDTPWVKGVLSRFEFIQHVFNHSTYHRGQVVTIGRNLGFTDAPMTDYNYYNMMVKEMVA